MGLGSHECREYGHCQRQAIESSHRSHPSCVQVCRPSLTSLCDRSCCPCNIDAHPGRGLARQRHKGSLPSRLGAGPV
ncbi:hypothetical protein PCLA_02r0805 [Pseudomonas citronellolis]|nr:hypothetical protein PCLA_02r0805 [Pseudomonas citronellolis]